MKKFLKGKQLIVFIVFLVFLFFFLFALFCSFTTASSEFFTKTFSRWYVTFFAFITSIIPLSLTEVFFVFIFITILFALIKCILSFKNKNKREGVFNISLIFTIIFGIVSSYYFACGNAYNREAIPVELYEEKVKKSEYLQIIS